MNDWAGIEARREKDNSERTGSDTAAWGWEGGGWGEALALNY